MPTMRFGVTDDMRKAGEYALIQLDGRLTPNKPTALSPLKVVEAIYVCMRKASPQSIQARSRYMRSRAAEEGLSLPAPNPREELVGLLPTIVLGDHGIKVTHAMREAGLIIMRQSAASSLSDAETVVAIYRAMWGLSRGGSGHRRDPAGLGQAAGDQERILRVIPAGEALSGGEPTKAGGGEGSPT
jgi:hypothetical protein